MKRSAGVIAVITALFLMLSGCSGGVPERSSPPSTEEPSDPTVTIVPAPNGADFGLAAERYDLPSGTPVAVSFGECTGDTDVLDLIGITASYDSLIKNNNLEFVFDAKFPVMFTAERYEGGEVIPDDESEAIPSIDRKGFAEKLSAEGEWTRARSALLSTPRHPYNFVPEGESFIPALDENGRVFVSLPLQYPGTYRYTLYFRESVDHTLANCTTGEELYSISFEVYIPVSDRDFDLIAVSGVVTHDVPYPSLWLLMRLNFGSTYSDWINFGWEGKKGGKLEFWDGSDWKEVSGGIPKEDGSLMGFTENQIFGVSVPFVAEEGGVYRVTLPFKSDGKKLELQFELDVGQEKLSR